jgi:glycosyltransferase involved in cell wall biosynthesis
MAGSKRKSIMKVVIAHPADPVSPGAGGAVRWAINVATVLSRSGYAVKLIGWGNPGRTIPDKLPFEFIPVFTGPYNWKRYVLELLIKLPVLGIDSDAIILTHRFDVMVAFVLWKPLNPKIMVSTGPLYAAKSLWPHLFPLIEKVYRFTERLVLPKIDVIGVMDQITYRRYDDMNHLPNEKLKWTWTAVDTDLFKPSNPGMNRRGHQIASIDKISIAFAGRLDRVKNLDFLLRSYAFLEKTLPEIELIIIGDGPEKRNLINLARSLKLENVSFPGEIPSVDMPEILSFIDIVVLPAIGGEGSPTILKEALACGIPVVTTNVGDVSKFIKHPLAGRVVKEIDERKFAEVITEVVSMVKKDREEVTKVCRSIARDFSMTEFSVHWGSLVLEAQSLRQNR